MVVGCRAGSYGGLQPSGRSYPLKRERNYLRAAIQRTLGCKPTACHCRLSRLSRTCRNALGDFPSLALIEHQCPSGRCFSGFTQRTNCEFQSSRCTSRHDGQWQSAGCEIRGCAGARISPARAHFHCRESSNLTAAYLELLRQIKVAGNWIVAGPTATLIANGERCRRLFPGQTTGC